MACCLFGAKPLSSPVLAYLIRPAGTIFKLSLMTMLFNIWSANWQPSFVCACVCLATNLLSYATCPSTWLVLLNCYFLWTGTGLSGMRWILPFVEAWCPLVTGLLPESVLTPLGQKSDFYTPKFASAGLVGTWAAAMHSSRYSYYGRRGWRVGLTFSGEQGRSDTVFSQPIAVGAGRY